MSYGKLLHSVPEALRKTYRKYEDKMKILIDAKWSVEFNPLAGTHRSSGDIKKPS